MTYKCLKCGHIFDEGEEKRWKSYIGELWGRAIYEEERGCPLCKSEYEETTICELCGSAHLESELTNGVCEECIEKYSTIDFCYEIGNKDKKEIKINGFLTTMFEESAIEEILYNYLVERSKQEKIDCTEYINEDIHWFVEEVKKNENGKK